MGRRVQSVSNQGEIRYVSNDSFLEQDHDDDYTITYLWPAWFGLKLSLPWIILQRYDDDSGFINSRKSEVVVINKCWELINCTDLRGILRAF